MKLFFMLALQTAVLTSPALGADEFPSAGSVSVASFSADGTGCPVGTVAANISPDNRALTLLFDSYVIDSTESSNPLVQKNCIINMSLKAPAGWRYALFSIDYRGFADLELGATARQSTEYSFGISGQKRIGAMELKGPVSVDYHERKVGEISELAWSDCGNGGGPDILTISTTAAVDSKAAPTERIVNVSSGGMRYTETLLESPVLAMDLVKKHSAVPCQLNKSYGFSGNKVWANRGCRADFKVTFDVGPVGPKPNGLLTVDSIDAQLYSGQEYGVAWQQCGQGRWVQVNGIQDCKRTCSEARLTQGRDPFGAECVSGEARPNSAAGTIQFKHGCWGSCNGQGNIKTDAKGPFCYQPGQTRDADKTDRIVGCYCK
jgi:hypothetical protein